MDLVDFGRYIGALLVTLALLGVAALVLRRLGPLLGAVGAPLAARPGVRPVELVQSLALDPRRRLVVVRFGGQEHLMLLGANGETIVAAAAITPVAGGDA